ncbi:formate--tetrahydrofolate ligase [Engelhardtia mirabilis]|uniref:Formate--tetrahydrofolate ligase n=1 Tax=Engelhardtia mirabilis TaxID=2528011 RepID=A0A518BQ65_9BACT|nr:Formate--tetrahydrofolate ligase [Planctomycetes bacterium Pla133]QDV03427.1 Formate--tetrahydrofolate ligase [Planctomycetes bacterium Pla86]
MRTKAQRDGNLRPIAEVAAQLDLSPDSVEPYGHYKAKLDHRLAAGDPPTGARLILVTAINPTVLGEGKTVHTIGLAQALQHIGHRAVCTVRQPSMGPIFGIKGGGTGGGRSCVEPRVEIDLHLTGDFHAVAAANNLLAAAIDTSIAMDNPLHMDPERVTWRRVVDINDRALRQVRTGLGGSKNGIPRDAAFDITSASEVMAILALSTDLADMRRRLGSIVVGETLSGKAITAEEIGAAGAMAAILKDALDPTLVQTTEGTPALVHTGPFANIAHGNCSVVADRLAGRICDYVVTEAGFGADMGAEKFVDIKVPVSGMPPAAAVVVVTVRALKVHSGKYKVRAGRPLPPEMAECDVEAVEAGCANLEAHLANLTAFGIPCVVAINRFPTDHPEELATIRRQAEAGGAVAVAESEVFARGGEGGRALAEAVVAASAGGAVQLRGAYAPKAPLKTKIEALATGVYGAGSVCFEARAAEQLGRLESAGHGGLPICMAKTQYSLSHDPKLRGRPTGFEFPVNELRLQAGAGFVVVLAGDIMTMPGMGRTPAYLDIDLDADGNVTGM